MIVFVQWNGSECQDHVTRLLAATTITSLQETRKKQKLEHYPYINENKLNFYITGYGAFLKVNSKLL